jgi:RNA recognition motif-containing protein
MFDTHEEAVAAINGTEEINGKRLFVSKFISNNDNEVSRSNANPISQQMNQTFNSNIFVRNIPKEVTEDEFKKEMSKAGNIISIKIKDTTIHSEG